MRNIWICRFFLVRFEKNPFGSTAPMALEEVNQSIRTGEYGPFVTRKLTASATRDDQRRKFSTRMRGRKLRRLIVKALASVSFRGSTRARFIPAEIPSRNSVHFPPCSTPASCWFLPSTLPSQQEFGDLLGSSASHFLLDFLPLAFAI